MRPSDAEVSIRHDRPTGNPGAAGYVGAVLVLCWCLTSLIRQEQLQEPGPSTYASTYSLSDFVNVIRNTAGT
jgi:hypothetical protein